MDPTKTVEIRTTKVHEVVSMPNPFFKFKQFTVHHDLCAMKVGVDGVLLGAWAQLSTEESILDIGTGSGLIALMMAQKSHAKITAIDIDEGAFQQASLNFKASQWSDRLLAVHASLQDFHKNQFQQFEHIITNPPFFNDSLRPAKNDRSQARHTDTLIHSELISIASEMLSSKGKISLILPCLEAENLIIEAAKCGLFCNRKTLIYSKPGVVAHRTLMEFGKSENSCIESELTIESEIRHSYNSVYKELTKDFYLKF